MLTLSERHRADKTEAELRAYATQRLGAQRCRRPYLVALGIVLGNMEHADASGSALHVATEVAFATPDTMRSITRQLIAAGLARRQSRRKGKHTHALTVYAATRLTGPSIRKLCGWGPRMLSDTSPRAAAILGHILRAEETRDTERRRIAPMHMFNPTRLRLSARAAHDAPWPACILAEDVPY